MAKIATEDAIQRIYEVGYHVISSIPEEEVGARQTAVHDMIEKAGGVIISQEHPKLIDLAYEMLHERANVRKKFTSAYFGWVKFEISPKEIQAIEEELRKHSDILRFILIETVKESTLIPKKIAVLAGRREDESEREKRVKEEKVLTDEELNKTIDELAPLDVLK